MQVSDDPPSLIVGGRVSTSAAWWPGSVAATFRVTVTFTFTVSV
jgi:hypothetical protein